MPTRQPTSLTAQQRPLHSQFRALLREADQLRQQGQYAQAEPMYRRALAIFEAALRAEHPKVVTCRKNYNRLPQIFGQLERRTK